MRRVMKTLFELILGVPTKLRDVPLTGYSVGVVGCVGLIGTFLVQVEG